VKQIQDLIQKSIDEIRLYQQESECAHHWEPDRYERIIKRLELARHIEDRASLWFHIESILYSLRDSGPSSSDFSPTLYLLADLLEHQRTRSKAK
jgi:hypothetical protein